MTDKEKEIDLDNLQEIYELLADEFSDYELSQRETLLDEETDEILIVIDFSKGMREYFAVISPMGRIKATSGKIPRQLLINLHDILLDRVFAVINATEASNTIKRSSSI